MGLCSAFCLSASLSILIGCFMLELLSEFLSEALVHGEGILEIKALLWSKNPEGLLTTSHLQSDKRGYLTSCTDIVNRQT